MTHLQYLRAVTLCFDASIAIPVSFPEGQSEPSLDAIPLRPTRFATPRVLNFSDKIFIMNGSGRTTRSTKRKASDSPSHGPPNKRAVNGKPQPPADDVEYVEYDGSDLGDLDGHAMYIGTPSSLGEWQDTIQNVVRNVVAIRFCQTCSFDTDPALTSEATGFVVDAERG